MKRILFAVSLRTVLNTSTITRPHIILVKETTILFCHNCNFLISSGFNISIILYCYLEPGLPPPC